MFNFNYKFKLDDGNKYNNDKKPTEFWAIEKGRLAKERAPILKKIDQILIIRNNIILSDFQKW